MYVDLIHLFIIIVISNDLLDFLFYDTIRVIFVDISLLFFCLHVFVLILLILISLSLSLLLTMFVN